MGVVRTAVGEAVRRRRYVLESRLDLLRAVGVTHMMRRRVANGRHRAALLSRKGVVAETMWREAAAAIGAEVRQLAPTLLEFRLEGAVTRVRGQTTPFADQVAVHIASDKLLSYRLLAEAGLPVPRHALIAVRDLVGATAFLQRAGGPCVVKPAQGGGGSGVTGEVRTAAQLRQALTYAGRFHPEALIEQQVPGDFYRVLVLDGEVLDIIRRSRPRLRGDGHSSVEELMFREYEQRIVANGLAGLKPLVVDFDCLFALEGSGYRLDSVIHAGEELAIKTATNYNGPEQSVTVPRPFPEALVEPAQSAAAKLGVRLAGVDILTTDVAVPLQQSGGVVLEANPVPGLNHHYNVADPEHATPVAVAILRSLLALTVSHA